MTIRRIHAHAAGLIHRWHRSHGRLAALVLAAAGLFPVSPIASAQGVAIELLDEQHAIDLEVTEGRVVRRGRITEMETTTTNREATSPTPFDITLRGRSPDIYARGDSDLFSIRAETEAADQNRFRQFASASPSTTLRFSTPADQLAPLTIDFVGNGQAYYSDGLVSLYDVTADTFVFNYSWNCCNFFGGTVPWVEHTGGPDRYTATVTPEPLLLASHVYELTMDTTTYAQDDGQSIEIGLSGLYVSPAPEAPAYAMMFIGLGLMGAWARRGRRPKG